MTIGTPFLMAVSQWPLSFLVREAVLSSQESDVFEPRKFYFPYENEVHSCQEYNSFL